MSCSISGRIFYLDKTGNTGRKELIMTAKDKEKLKIAKITIGKVKDDLIVLDPENFRARADILNKEFYEAGKGEKDKANTPDNEVKMVDDCADEEQMSFDIVMKLAFMTEERFEDIVFEMGIATVKQLVRRIEETDPETAVKMLQTMFLTYGKTDMACALDILNICAEHDEDTYCYFMDALFDSDIFDWFSVENMFDDYREDEPDDNRPWKR